MLKYSKDRVAEAKEIREKWYNGEKIHRLPFEITTSAPCSNAWILGNPYSFGELSRDSDKALRGQLMGMQHRFDTFPDCDYLPVFQLFYLGEGILASMFGAKQLIVEDNPPYTEGRLLKNIYELDKLPKKIDVENSEWGQKLKEHVFKFLDATNGEIPIAVADYQSTYGTATKLLPNEELMLAMYDEPELVHALFKTVTSGIVDLIETMKNWVGEERLATNANNPIPKKCGLILWDDYVSVVSPKLYKEFCVPYNTELFERYGYGHLHTCGPYFPGYLEAALACNPKSMDASIMRGMGKSREDLLEFRKITREHDVALFGGLEMNAESIFNEEKIPPDFELFEEFVDGRYFLSLGGTPSEVTELLELVKKLEHTR